MQKKTKKRLVKPLVLMLAASQCMTAFAGTWVSNAGQWSYVQDDGTKAPNGFFIDPADQKKYYLDNEGVIVSGWKFIDSCWYFFNTVHDGTYGSAITSKWQWIDGYCYMFDADGKLYTNTTTPDGFAVNEAGQWTENGKAVYTGDRGIPATEYPTLTSSIYTAKGSGSKSSRSSGGSSGGGGGNSSSKTTYYSYTVKYVDAEGNVLLSTNGTTKRYTFVTVEEKSFDGYTYESGQTGAQKVTADGTVFVVTYKKTENKTEEKEDTKPDIDKKTEEETKYSYTVKYIDKGTGELIDTVTGEAKANASVSVKNAATGYTPVSGNISSFTVTKDKTEIILYFEKMKETYSYTIKYEDEAGNILATIAGTGEQGQEIEIPDKSFDKYERVTDSSSFTLTENDLAMTIRYKKISIATDSDATPSDSKKAERKYSITYIDKDTGAVKMKETGKGMEDEGIIPDLSFDGYSYADSYSFTITNGDNAFKVYLVNDKEPEIFKEVRYTVLCQDENGKDLKTFTGTVTVGNDPVDIETDYKIDGYERNGSGLITVEADGENQFVLIYNKKYNAAFQIICMDIDSMTEIETKTIEGNAGESLDISDICPTGYKAAGDLPENVMFSSNPNNNVLKLYFKKVKEKEETKKETRYTIQFRAKDDPNTVIVEDITGTWTVGEKLPYYFATDMNTADGKSWTAVGDSPQIFEMKDQEMNTFLIEFIQTGETEEKDTKRIYSIKYVAEDTGSVLGVTTGISSVGERVAYSNTFDGYGFMTTEGNYHVITEENNSVTVTLKRTKFPAPEVNEHTGKYDGFEWLALFVDSNGNQLLPNVSGFTVKGDRLYLNYPDEIIEDGVTYRAVSESPYIEYTDQTTYRQYVIQYVTGDPSEEKLEEWQNKAQEKKDEFFGTTPYHYFVAYREKNSWNDVGLRFDVAAKDSAITIEELDIPGWNAPEENLGSFALDTDGKSAVAQYEKPNGGTSIDYNERSYTLHITDENGNDLFDPYSGKFACVKGNSPVDFPVYFPQYFYDAEGNRWEADEESPKNFVLSAMDENDITISYHKAYENEKEQFIVTSNKEFNQVLNDFASHTNDTAVHDYYVIGRDYDTSVSEVSQTMSKYNLAGYSNEIVDTFNLNGVAYTISHVKYYRKWNAEVCEHEWKAVEDLTGSCLVSSKHTVKCTKCGEEVSVTVPAVGHKDKDNDGSCDACGTMLSQNLGDELTVTWDSGSLGFGKKAINFTCIDTDYNGSGKMLYIATTGIGSDIYGSYTNANSADYSSSRIRQFLDDEFADGLSLKDNLQTIDGTAVSILTKAEYDKYVNAAENQFDFPAGTYLAKSEEEASVSLTNGSTVSKEDASNYQIYPVILLNRSEDDSVVRSNIWNVGDLQAREINGKLYLFRCVNANYTDKSNTDKSMALFLCDTVIPSSEGLGFDEADETQSTRFFGDTNNYKYSVINEWLTENIPDNDNFVKINIGIKNEYTGSSAKGLYESVTDKSFARFTRSNAQVMYSGFFIPSLEEAIAMKDYLWKFNRSDKDNADEIVTKYRTSYWLRTPQYGTSDMIYTVNLQTGAIEPRSVKATADNDLCDIGIRPMYVLYQNS